MRRPDAALGLCLARGWARSFLCSSRKVPPTEDGFKDASADKRQIHDWSTAGRMR